MENNSDIKQSSKEMRTETERLFLGTMREP